MKRKDWRNLAGTVMWFFAGMFFMELCLHAHGAKGGKASKRGALPS